METTLLFVEENSMVANAVTRGIEELKPGWKVIQASSYRQAKDISSQGLPAAAVLDTGLPDGDGFELLADLRRIEPRLPVVMISDEPPFEINHKPGNGHAYQLVAKPFAISEVIAKLERELHAACMVSQSGNGSKKPEKPMPMPSSITALALLPEKRQLALCYF